ncbi:GNAT family N-acetyltransferase [Brevibacillus humidisoli]|uniref:GNAT family N-acetyltransferase n=1 Tax=Brevibacillus humidisoli TaxID=2895522 RepID=UPI001E603CDB|nr:GNAT family N-acetyltransferase [Brevibacillus humidisoli]UFJ39484.1 GNAT family N-acetyltransferase [Brevibacillus humidisoli]
MEQYWQHEEFVISTEKRYLNLDLIHTFLSQDSYWAKGVPREVVEKAVQHSALCFGLYRGDPRQGTVEQVGFGRVISDLATFAYLADVFILPSHRGLGLSKWLVRVIVEHPELSRPRRFMLATQDAHTLYHRYGFAPLDKPGMFLQKVTKNPYGTES